MRVVFILVCMWKQTGIETKMMYYEASKIGGEVRSVHKKSGVTRVLSKSNVYGYLCVNVPGLGTPGVHQLVAMAHLPKPENWNDTWSVDHKSIDKTNNDADNLRWASPSMQSFNRRPNSRGGIDSCPVVGIHTHTGRVIKFPSASVAEALFKFINDVEENYEIAEERFECPYRVGESNRIHHSGISMCLMGKRKMHGNYVWTTLLEEPDIPGEKWVDLKSTCGIYKMYVSNEGRVKYEFKNGYNKKVSSREKMSDRMIEETDRYPAIIINNVPYQLHRLVWETFVGPIPDTMVVHHKNHDKRDARVSNLELTTTSVNIKLAYVAGRFEGNKNAWKKVSIDGVEYESESQASEKLGISRKMISCRIKNDNFPTYVKI